MKTRFSRIVSMLAALALLLPSLGAPGGAPSSAAAAHVDPRANSVPALSVPPLPLSALAAHQPAQIESVTGWLTVLWGDGQLGANISKQIYFITDDNGTSTRLDLDGQLLQSAGGLMALNGKRVVVTGQRVRTFAQGVSTEVLQVQSVRLDVPAGAAAPSAAQAVTGPQPWVSILCKFADVITETKPLTYFQNMYSSSYPGLDHYWREVSYNMINVVGSGAYGWYTLPYTRSHYVYDMDGDGQVEFDFTRATNDCTAAGDPYVYYPNYVGINLMFNAELDGFAWGGGRYLTLDGVYKRWNMTWEPPWGYADITVMSHEMGHGFGLPHSSGAYGQTYDNQWDVMSDTWSNCSSSRDPVYGCLGQHTISYHKDILGWIPVDRRYTLAPGEKVTITLEQLALPPVGNYLMARVPITGSTRYFYTVEARRKTGYDVKLPGQAVIIHEVDTTRGNPAHVIDVDNNGNTGDAGAQWIPGETFSDTLHGITVTVISATTTGFVVTINNQSLPRRYYVAPNGSDAGNNCTNSASPCATIQRAADIAEANGDIRVSAGTYTGVSARNNITQVVYISNTVMIRGGYTTTNWTTSYPVTQPTTLDAQGRGRVVYVANYAQPIMEGLRLTGGNATGLGGAWGDSGGAVYAAVLTAPTIRNCTILNSTAQTGGGVFLSQSTATLSGNTVISNSVSFFGGGVLVFYSNADTLDGNIVLSNTAQYGGGLYLYQSNPQVMNNVVADNRASVNGSGVYVDGSSPTVLHTTFARNKNGDGSGVYLANGSTVALTNTILVSQTSGIIVPTGNTARLEATLWGSGAWANGADWSGSGTLITGTINVRGDPAFISPATGNYHIAWPSAAIDAGVNAGVTFDMDGEKRPLGNGYDIGADEFLSGPALIVTQEARPEPVQAGERLTYTLRITNTGDATLHGIVTDVLPVHVTPTGTLTWTAVITAPVGVWTRQVVITTEVGYIGPVTNVVRVTTDEGAMGSYTKTVAVVGALTTITVTPNPATVTVGATQAFTATGADAAGNVVPISPMWSTDAGTMPGNILTAQTTPVSGRHVTATVGSISGTAIVNVVAGPLHHLTITPTAVTLAMHEQQQFSAAGYDVSGNLISGLALSWQVTLPDAGTINSSGLFTAGMNAGVYPGAVRVSSGAISQTADVAVYWSYHTFLPLVSRRP